MSQLNQDSSIDFAMLVSKELSNIYYFKLVLVPISAVCKFRNFKCVILWQIQLFSLLWSIYLYTKISTKIATSKCIKQKNETEIPGSLPSKLHFLAACIGNFDFSSHSKFYLNALTFLVYVLRPYLILILQTF